MCCTTASPPLAVRGPCGGEGPEALVDNAARPQQRTHLAVVPRRRVEPAGGAGGGGAGDGECVTYNPMANRRRQEVWR